MNEIIQFLENRVILFKGFPKETLNKIIASSKEARFDAGNPIIQFGKQGSNLGVMLEGDAEALIRGTDNEKRRVGMLSSGDIFGEMSLMTSEKTFADVIGISPCKVLWIPQEIFYSTIIPHPQALKFLSKTLMERTIMNMGEKEQMAGSAKKEKGKKEQSFVPGNQNLQNTPVPVEVSAHHIHLCEEDIQKLFGNGHQLTRESDLSQPGQFACKEKVNLAGPKGRVENVRILGPARKMSQVEIAMTEQYKLGIRPPIRESGDVAGSPGITLEGSAGTANLSQGVICALRHVHMTPEEASAWGLKDKNIVRVRIDGDRELIFGDVVVRVNPSFKLAMHIDTDEANAANIKTGVTGYIEGIQDHI